MSKVKMPRFKKGNPLSAKDLDKLAESAERVENFTAIPPLEISTAPGSMSIRMVRSDEIYAKITSGTNPYAWSEVEPATGGTFTTATWGYSGTTTADPAYEQTGNTTIAANTIVRMRRARETGEWIFHFAKC